MSLLLLNGCALNTPVVSDPSDPMMESLNHIAEKAEHNTALLIEAQKTQQQKDKQKFTRSHFHSVIVSKSGEFKINYKGSVVSLIDQLSDKIGYKTFIINRRNRFDVNISIKIDANKLSIIIDQINAKLPQSIKVIQYINTKSLVVKFCETGKSS